MKELLTCKVCGKPVPYSKTGYCNKHATQSAEHRTKNSRGQKEFYSRNKESRGGKGFGEAARISSVESHKANSHEQFLNNPRKFYTGTTLKRNMLYAGVSYKCHTCGVTEWEGQTLNLEVHHIDGDKYNNSLSNLKFLCPNCHSQTASFRRKKHGKKVVGDEELLEAIRQHSSIRQALISLELDLATNYPRANALKRSGIPTAEETGLEPGK